MRKGLILLAVAMMAGAAVAQMPAAPTSNFASADDTRNAMRQALRAREQAQARSEKLEREAQSARSAADKTAREAAALAARIQQAEAGIAAATARGALVERERERLMEQLGGEQQPVVRLTAALQQFSRRPVALSMLRSGSVSDLVHTRAMLATAVPQVQARTGALRARIARSRALRSEARDAMVVLQAEELRLAQRQGQLATLQAQQQQASRQASGVADREAERALALGEQARDLNALVADLDRAGSLRETLAALPGPVLRPDNPSAARPAPVNEAVAQGGNTGGPPMFILPVTGRLVAGFGAPLTVGTSKGLTLAPRGGAQVVAPAAGRVAFAGVYRGFGRIVIIEHPGGWTSLITGLARTGVAVGDELVGGAPLGTAPPGAPIITLELRQRGQPVNPLPLVG